MGVLAGARYHVRGQGKPDDAGKLGAMKVARPVWRGLVGKGAAMPPRRLATLLTNCHFLGMGGTRIQYMFMEHQVLVAQFVCCLRIIADSYWISANFSLGEGDTYLHISFIS